MADTDLSKRLDVIERALRAILAKMDEGNVWAGMGGHRQLPYDRKRDLIEKAVIAEIESNLASKGIVFAPGD